MNCGYEFWANPRDYFEGALIRAELEGVSRDLALAEPDGLTSAYCRCLLTQIWICSPAHL